MKPARCVLCALPAFCTCMRMLLLALLCVVLIIALSRVLPNHTLASTALKAPPRAVERNQRDDMQVDQTGLTVSLVPWSCPCVQVPEVDLPAHTA